MIEFRIVSTFANMSLGASLQQSNASSLSHNRKHFPADDHSLSVKVTDYHNYDRGSMEKNLKLRFADIANFRRQVVNGTQNCVMVRRKRKIS